MLRKLEDKVKKCRNVVLPTKLCHNNTKKHSFNYVLFTLYNSHTTNNLIFRSLASRYLPIQLSAAKVTPLVRLNKSLNVFL